MQRGSRMCTVFWDGLLHRINHPKARADSACGISHPGRFCQQNKTPICLQQHRVVAILGPSILNCHMDEMINGWHKQIFPIMMKLTTMVQNFDHNIDKYIITLMKWAICECNCYMMKLKLKRNEWNSPHRWKRQTGYNLYDISTLQMDEVNLRSNIFHLYGIWWHVWNRIHVMKWNSVTHGMKCIARKWYDQMGEIYDTNEIHKSQSHPYQLNAPQGTTSFDQIQSEIKTCVYDSGDPMWLWLEL
jgi:hypothetical protein